MTEPLFLFYYGLLGLSIGLLAGLAGVGGGGMTVPIFTYLLALQGVQSEKIIHLALGTSMACMIMTISSSVLVHYQNKNIEHKMLLRMFVGILLGTFISTFIASYVKGVFLALFFSAFMMYVAFSLFRSKPRLKNTTPHGIVGNSLTGLGIGATSALVSIGGGGLLIPYLIHQNLNVKRAIGTSMAISLPVVLSGTLGYVIHGWHYTDWSTLTIGYVYLPAVIIFSFFSFFSAHIGAKYSMKLHANTLKKVIAILSVILSIRMLIFALS